MADENIYTFENEEYRKTYWHTCSHVLVQTVLLEQLAHGHVHERNVGVSGNTVLSGNIHRKDIGKETAVLQFLHHGQQRGAQSLRGSSRHLTIRRKRWEAEE